MSDKNRPSIFGGNNRNDDDDDDEKGRPASSSGRSNNPFNRPSPFNRSDDNDEEEDEEEEKERPASPANRSGSLFGGSKSSDAPKSGSPFGSKSSDAPKSGGAFGSKSSDAPRPGSPFGSKSSDASKSGSPFGGKPSEAPKPGGPFGSKSGDSSRSTGTFGSKPNDPPKSGGLFGGKSSEPAKSTGLFGGKPAESPKPSSPFGTASKPGDAPKPGGLFGGSKTSAQEAPKPGLFGGPKAPEKKDDKPAGGAKPLFGGGKPPDKKDEKKDDKPGGGGLFGRSPFGGGNKADEKKDDKPAGGTRLPFGGGAKPAEKKDDKPAGGGLKLPFGGGGAKPADKKDDKPAARKDDKGGGGGLLGGFKLPFGGGARADDKGAAKPAVDAKRASSTLPAPNVGNKPAMVTSAPKAAGTDDKGKPAGRGDKTARPLDRSAKPVVVKSQGLSLDQKLDIAGYMLMGTAVVIFFGYLNPTDGSVTATIARLFLQLFGWAAYVLPIPFFGVGLWLLIRHFRETPHVLDVKRSIGLVLMYLTIVVTLHLFALPPVDTMAKLETASARVAQSLQGGGWVGDRLYIFLVKVVAGDAGTVAVLAGAFIISVTLAFEITMAEISTYAKSVFQWFARMFGSYKETRRVSIEAREADRAAKAAAAAALQPPGAVPAIAAGPKPAAAALAAPGRGKGRVPDLEAVNDEESLPAPAPLPALAAETPRLRPSAPPAPLGSRPVSAAATAVAPAEEVEEAEVSDEELEPAAPAARPAPAPFGSRQAGGKPGDGATKADGGKKPGLFGGRASPFGGGSKNAPPPDDEAGEDEGTPAPIPALPGAGEDEAPAAKADGDKKPGLFGAKPAPFGTKAGDAPKAEAPVAVKPEASVAATDAPAKTDNGKKGGLFGGRSLPFGSKPSKDATVDAPDKDKASDAPAKADDGKKGGLFGGRSQPFGSTPASEAKVEQSAKGAEADEADNEPDKTPARADDSKKPGLFGAKPAPFGAKPAAAKAEPVDEADEEEEAPAPKPGLFGAKPAPFGSKAPAGKAETADEADDEEEEDAPPVPVSPKPSMFGARPSSPFGKAGSDAKDDEEPEDDDPPSAPISKPSPFGSRPTPGPKDGDKGQGKGSFSRPFDVTPTTPEDEPIVASKTGPSGASSDKPAEKQDQKAQEPVARVKLTGSAPADPPAAASAKPEAKASEPIKVVVPRPAVPNAEKPADPTDTMIIKAAGSTAPASPADKVEKVEPVEKADKPESKPDGEAKRIKLGPEIAAAKAEAQDPKPAGTPPQPAEAAKKPNPFGTFAASKAEAKAEDAKPADAPLKPATPTSGKPSPFGTFAAAKPSDKVEPTGPEQAKPTVKPSLFGAPAGATSRPVPKPGMATPPPLEDEEAVEDDEPKYVDLDSEDDPPPSGPRPTVAGKLGAPLSNMPRPAPPVTGRQRPEDSNAKAGPLKPSPFGTKLPFATADDPAKAADAPEKAQAAAKPVDDKARADTVGPTAPAVPPKAGPETIAAAPVAPKPEVKAEAKPEVKAEDKPAPKPAAAPLDAKAAAALEGKITRSRPPSAWDIPDFRDVLQPGSQQKINDEILEERKRVIEETLSAFGAPAKVVEVNAGPVITQFGVEPGYLSSRGGKATRVKVSAIARLDADLALALAARTIRIEAPVPGKSYVGIEVPNAETALVGLRDIMESETFQKIDSKLRIALGKSVDGAPIAADLTMMPHLLIAGTTGSGKSVCVNAIISCLLLENSPDDMKFIMVDPKRVELTNYNGIPHLISPVVVDLERIAGVLKWVSREMDERYKKFSAAGARNILDYNSKLKPTEPRLPYLVVVIDELADLMMLAPEETEKVLTRLAQMARATGIHLIISTQRPSVDVVTGLIKANFPARISFAVASSVDSRVVLDSPGAEKLLGRGDMLYQSPDSASPVRMQGVYVSDMEINRITRHWKGIRPDPDTTRGAPALSTILEDSGSATVVQSRPAEAARAVVSSSAGDDNIDEDDALYLHAVEEVKRVGKASSLFLQRRLQIGPVRAERLIKLMEQRGVINPNESHTE